jgi:hypothetical protein
LAGATPAALDDTSVATDAQARHGELTGATGLVELDPLTLTPRTDATADHDIMEDPMLVELAASLASSRAVAWPSPVTQLVDEAPAVVTCDSTKTPSQHADSTRLTPPPCPASTPVSPQ